MWYHNIQVYLSSFKQDRKGRRKMELRRERKRKRKRKTLKSGHRRGTDTLPFSGVVRLHHLHACCEPHFGGPRPPTVTQLLVYFRRAYTTRLRHL